MEVQSRGDCLILDVNDLLRDCRDRFIIPEGAIYLDGNSLGALPKGIAERVSRTITEEWGKSLITSWNVHGWFDLPRRIGDRIGLLIGAPAGTVVACDTISINVYKLLGAAVKLRPGRKIILSDTGNFPTDLYMVQGLIDLLGNGYELKLAEPDAVEASITEEVAVVLLTEVDYRTSRLHDMRSLTKAAHAKGALIIWDLAHSAGAMPIALASCNADFAVGCTYKYLNGGPGSPAFLYVRQDLQNRISSPLSGWWGHDQPFAFEIGYRAAPGIARQQCGTQPIIAMAALEAALDAWEGIDLKLVRQKSLALAELFISQVEHRCARHGVKLAGPRDMTQRGSHVSFHCPHGYAVMQALIAEHVTGDFREPDIIRFGLTPLYTRYVDVWDAADRLGNILDGRRWDRPEWLKQKAVT